VKHADDGYTLTEMLVVIGIIALLAAVLTPVLIGQMGRARAKAARLQVDNIATSVEMFRTDVGRYPSAQEGLAALHDEPEGVDGWLGPYVRNEKALLDPWGKPLAYALEAQTLQPSVTSLGADGKVGGRGADADLVAP